LLLALGILAGCQGPPASPPRQPPVVPVVARWAPGTRCLAVLAPGHADDLDHRAAAVWWREALRQSVAFDVVADGDGAAALPRLELTIDRAQQALAASWRTAAGPRVVAGTRIADGDLPAAIDDLAWRTRLALGEAAGPPLPIALATSPRPTVVVAVEDARALLRDGGFTAAVRALRQARAEDGAAPFVLEGLAATTLLLGDAPAAVRIAREALGYEARLLPVTAHRLARTLLLARATAEPRTAADRDRDLRLLGEVARRERPHDPEPVLSLAIAHNFLGDFAAALPLLDGLGQRLPEHAIVDYHLGWARLGTGDAAGAGSAFARAALRLPAPWVLLPQAIALHESGQQLELRALLARHRAEAEAAAAPLLYDLLRMQAAEAMLARALPAVREPLLAALHWLAQHPAALAMRAGEFAEQGTLAIRLGAGDELPALLAAVQAQHAHTPVADVCTFLAGMLEVQRRRERLPAAEQTLSGDGESPWALLLAAWAHELRGELADRQQALARANLLADSPMTKALLAHGLRAAGAGEQAELLLATLRAELRRLRLRSPCRHPLLGPELAFAFVDP
jgi:tetratricopeptide (TPR) repeat protein